MVSQPVRIPSMGETVRTRAQHGANDFLAMRSLPAASWTPILGV